MLSLSRNTLVIAAVLAINVATASNPSYFFTVTNKHSSTFMSKELIEQFNFVYKLEVRNDTIYPFYCLDSLGSECFPKIPYMLKSNEGKSITVKYFEEAIEENDEKDVVDQDMNFEIELFSTNTNDTITLREPIDFPIMFFDDDVKTVCVGSDFVIFNNEKFDCYKFKLLDFPVKGYSFIYLNKSDLVPIKYEVFSFASKKEKNSIKGYSSINLYKIQK